MENNVKKVVLAYSGGLDTSIIIKWLTEEYGCEVVAFVADVGQGAEVETLGEKALKSGACDVFIKDLREEFARDFVNPMLRAAALYEGTYMLGTSIARPLISKAHMEVVRETGADAVSHGATGKGNDQVRFELSYYAIDPHIKVIAPWRIWDLKGREDLIAYAKKHNIEVTVTKKKPYSMDRNLFHLSFEGGILEDPSEPAPEDMFVLSVSPEAAPDKPTFVTIGYKEGDAVSIDGEELSSAALLERLNLLGGENGIGRVDMVESRYVGMKSRGVYETPGGAILHSARRAVESLTMDREVIKLRDSLISSYAELVYNGYWFTPERESMQALVDEATKPVTGTVKLKLYKGNIIIEGREAEGGLYHPGYATFEEDAVYNQRDAGGFIKVNALRLKLLAMTGRNKIL